MQIAFPHEPDSIGGPGSFQTRISAELRSRGWTVVYPGDRVIPDVVMVVGGTRKLRWLRCCRKQGAQVIHRLDGIKWLHRTGCVMASPSITAFLGNHLVALIRRHVADTVVYQSEFVKDWWNREFGTLSSRSTVIRNGVDLNVFRPGDLNPTRRLLCVEGTVEYSPVSIGILEKLAQAVEYDDLANVFDIYGRVGDDVKRRFQGFRKVHIMGTVSRERIHTVYPGSVFVSLDVNPACPNSVIEAMASGCPVVGFATGALPELVSPQCGVLVNYEADVWKLEAPNYDGLVGAVARAFAHRTELSASARSRAERCFDLADVTEAYLKLLYES